MPLVIRVGDVRVFKGQKYENVFVYTCTRLLLFFARHLVCGVYGCYVPNMDESIVLVTNLNL